MIEDQYIFDKTYIFENTSENNLLNRDVKSIDDVNFSFGIEGVSNYGFSINKDIQAQIISNKVSELVYFSFEIQRQVLFLYKDKLSCFPKEVLDAILECTYKLKRIYCSKFDYEWYDHCVSNRALFLRDLLIVLAKLDMKKDYEKVFKLHRIHIKFILKSTNYDYLTNHGIITDTFGLLALRGIESNEAISKAKRIFERSLYRIDHYISDDGIPLESSTTYWFLIYKLYKKLQEIGSKYYNLELLEEQLNKLSKTETFFNSLYLNGKYLRIGQSSGSHKYPKDVYKPRKPSIENVLQVNQYDTGLILISGFSKKGLYFQLIINTQSIHPKVHGHEDLGTICLYYNGDIIIDTSGSHKFKNSSNDLKIDPKSFKNQSLVYEENGDYLDEIRNLKILITKKKINISFDLSNLKTSINRMIKLDLEKSEIEISDNKIMGEKHIISQLLMASSGEIRDNKYQIKDILITSNNKINENIGYLSLERNTIKEVPLLTQKHFSSNNFKINLSLENSMEIKQNINKKQYSLRENYKYRMLLTKTKRRIVNLFIKINRKF